MRKITLLPLLFALFAFTALAQNPVIPGDHPDPSIIRVGQTYWTASTSGDWAPAFPLFRSNDLHHWIPAHAIFPQPPSWASGSFWAPELVNDNGHILVFYVARKTNGPLCVAVATAPAPQGPYTDHGPLICQQDGSIDPAFARDENGKPFLIWKEDGNSIQKPTPIFAQPLTPDLLHLTGEKTQLIVNEPSTWEGGVVEAPYILRHNGKFFLFYAGNACCGTGCHYAEGVARADHLLGPWEKNPANPIIGPNSAWKCPGHGTAVSTPAGKDFFIYHAYPSDGTIYVGRESVLDPITWNPDGWPSINSGHGPSGGHAPGNAQPAPAPAQTSFTDTFQTSVLDSEWKWPLRRSPTFHAGGGHLTLQAATDGRPAFLAGSLLSPGYIATVAVDSSGTAQGGLGIIGTHQSGLTLLVRGNHLELSQLSAAQPKLLWQTTLTAPAPTVWLRVHSAGRTDAAFSYSLDHQHWLPAGDPASVANLPPWDQGLRIALLAAGDPNTSASFSHFALRSAETTASPQSK